MKNRRISDIYQCYIDDMSDETLNAFSSWENSRPEQDGWSLYNFISVLLLLDLVR